MGFPEIDLTKLPADTQETMTRVFQWHPKYVGKTALMVYEEIWTQLKEDQQDVARILERSTGQTTKDDVHTLMRLDEKWGDFSNNWANDSAAELLPKVLAFHMANDRLRRLRTYRDAMSELEHYEEFRRKHGRDELNIDVLIRRAKPIVVVAVVIVLLLWVIL